MALYDTIWQKLLPLTEKERQEVLDQFIVDIVYQHFNARSDDATFFTSNNMVVPTDDFREIGGFS